MCARFTHWRDPFYGACEVASRKTYVIIGKTFVKKIFKPKLATSPEVETISRVFDIHDIPGKVIRINAFPQQDLTFIRRETLYLTFTRIIYQEIDVMLTIKFRLRNVLVSEITQLEEV